MMIAKEFAISINDVQYGLLTEVAYVYHKLDFGHPI